MTKISALFVQFRGTDVLSYTDGWVFRGFYNEELTLRHIITKLEAEIKATAGMQGLRTVRYKVVNFNE